MRRRILPLILAAVIVLGMIPVLSASAEYENDYTLTGNQRKDILGVALTQMGYTEGPHNGKKCGNDTKYGTWYGYPYQPWCAMFVSWCARQADISKSILSNSAKAGPQPQNFDIAYYPGTEYTPVPGDLVFKSEFSHVGLVYEVKGDIVITIEGNVNYDDDENDGFTVCFRERKISESVFGVPEYEGCDTCPSTGADHKYVRGHNDSHPHANYFYCTACGDTYYTGTNAQVTSCASCKSCGCTTDYAGLYKVTGVKDYVNLRSGHGGGYSMRDIRELGEIVEVTAGNGKWAHVVHGPYTYYASMSYLTRYVPKPGNVKASEKTYYEGDTARITWSAAKTATSYQIVVKRDSKQILNQDVGSERSFELTDLQPGQYEVSVTAKCADAVSAAGTCSFNVLELFDITYDGRGGSNVPEAQQKIEGKKLTLSSTVPEKEGYTFLGWNTDKGANFCTIQPGDTWSSDKDATLYAIWRANDAVPQSLQIVTPAKKDIYIIGDELDTTGLELKLNYSDGSADLLKTGYETEGFRSDIEAEVTVTVTYQGLSTSYLVQVLEYLPGDIDLNLVVDKEDVMQLLWHISFPDMFPIEVPADFTGDGVLDKEDVMQLLWHVSFPDMFPLM